MAVLSDPRTQEPLRPDVFWRWVWASVRPYRGQFLFVLGFICLLIGYLGVSREVFVGRQIPYLVSGGLVGVALVSLGSRYVLIEDMRRDFGRLERLEEAVQDLRSALLAPPDAPRLDDLPPQSPAPGSSAHDGSATTGPRSARSYAPRSPGNGRPGTVVVVNGGGSYHRSECPVVAGKELLSRVTPEAAQHEGLRACRMCNPITADA